MNGIVSKIIMVGFVLFHLSPATKLELVRREEWNARPASSHLFPLSFPIKKVIISETDRGDCTFKNSCIIRVYDLQGYHMHTLDFLDIGYNFLIGGDGLVYEGRGWGQKGAHTKGHNNDSIGIAFIGTFDHEEPPWKQKQAAHMLIEEGVSLKYLSSDYKLYGHRQFRPRKVPGDALYEIIKNWCHWSAV